MVDSVLQMCNIVLVQQNKGYMPAKKQTKVIKKVMPKAPVKKLAKVGGLTTWVSEGSTESPAVDVETMEVDCIPCGESEAQDQLIEHMATVNAQFIGSMLLAMEADEGNFYNIRMKAGRCIIERLGASPAMVIEDNLHDALVAIGGAG